MRKVSSIILILCVVALCIIPCKVEAFTHSVKLEELYGHRSPDGTISFYVPDAKRSWIGDDDWYFSLHKVFTNEGQQFYYLYTDVSDGDIKKNPVTDVLIFINDKPVSLKPIQGFDATNNGKKYSGWYLVPQEIGQTLEKTQTFS